MSSTLRVFQIRSAMLCIGLSLSFYACDESAISFDEPNTECNAAGVSSDCFYPYPSDVFRVENEGKFQIEFTDDALPSYKKIPLRMEIANPIDGYAIHPPIFASLGEALDVKALTFHTQDMSQTLLPSSSTLILEADTLKPVAHFAELDATVAVERRNVVQIRLLQALKPSTRYIVALQKLTNQNGEIIPRLESFEHLAFTRKYPYFLKEQKHTREQILPKLESFGVDLADVQLAWDFTTRSDASARGELESMMEQTQRWLDAQTQGPAIDIEKVTEYLPEAPPEVEGETAAPWHSSLRYRIEATVEAPLYLNNDKPGARMQFDAQGMPTFGTTTAKVPVLILIPHSVVDNSGDPSAIIQFGHGFFGSTAEMENGFLPAFLQANTMAAVGIDWWGLSSSDLGQIMGGLVRAPARIFHFTERLQQAFSNQTVLARATSTSMPALDTYGSYLDSDVHSFYGISLGHILGSTAVAVSREIDTTVLSVGGASFSFLMSRAKPFEALMGFVLPNLRSPTEGQKFFALASLAMEKVDPTTYANQLLRNDFSDGAVDRRVLAQTGLGDPDVPTLSALIWARSVGIPLATPAPMDVFEIPTTTLPSDDSAYVLFDFSLEGELPGTYSSFPDNLNAVHSLVRVNAAGQTQIKDFLLNGMISDACNGVCVFD